MWGKIVQRDAPRIEQKAKKKELCRKEHMRENRRKNNGWVKAFVQFQRVGAALSDREVT